MSPNDRSMNMRWEKPGYQELRYGMEITMYISNR
ncbi:MAG: pyrroloquinoline quinone precursor peptide PqqA [Coxiellaceae bacterium]|nr:pyrroloquinoline quinone precursor peptide PqqA [Coxiellaceae bacterium]